LKHIGLAQYHPSESLEENLRWVEDIMERAGRENCDIICFSHDFLGPSTDDGAALRTVQSAAKQNNIEVITGRIALSAEKVAQSVVIAPDGRLGDSIPLGEIKALETSLGPAMVLSEAQAYNPGTDELARKLRPKVMIMQTNAISFLELEAIKELAIDRSFNQAHLVVCASDVGPCAEEQCLGTSLAVFQGEILVEADITATDLITFTVEMSNFIDYDVLRDSVTIPELLRQKGTFLN
jgi:hypothetical protein